MAGVTLPVSAAGDKVAGVITKLHHAVSVFNGHPAPYAIVGVVCFLSLWRDEPDRMRAGFIILPSGGIAKCVCLCGASSAGVVFIRSLLPSSLLNLCFCDKKVVFCIIMVLCLAPFTVPCAYQVVVFVIFMAQGEAVRCYLSCQTPVSVVFPPIFCPSAAGFSCPEILAGVFIGNFCSILKDRALCKQLFTVLINLRLSGFTVIDAVSSVRIVICKGLADAFREALLCDSAF